jgi:folate-binding protein YgfZ
VYLQGQLSQDVDAIDVGEKAWSFVLEPNGHIVALVSVWRLSADVFSLEVDTIELAQVVAARLQRFLLRTKAAITYGDADSDAAGDVDDAARIAEGRPGSAEFDERAVPAETGWVDRAVSFTKGCYTGQELVARMDSRVAEPPRRLVRARASGDIARGAPIVVDGAEVGHVTSAAGPIALGYVKRGTPLSGAATIGDAHAKIEVV